jgi:hypothetical protein
MPVIINGTTGIDTVQDGIVTDDKLNLTANSQEIKDALNAGGSAPIYAARAWVNFNGTGTVAIRASGNVSSITDDNVGRYTVNFTTSMPDANYATPTSCAIQETVLGTQNGDIYVTANATGSYLIQTANSGTYTDMAIVTSAVFR